MKLLFLILLIASMSTAPAEEYRGYGISFQVPDGWHIAQNNTTGMVNDTKIVVTDNASAIRIDAVTFPQLPWIRSISTNSFQAQDLALGYYKNELLNLKDKGVSGSGSIYKPAPDGISPISYGTVDDGMEWFLVWTKDDYGEKFVGVHAVFEGSPEMVVVYNGGSWNATMPVALYDLLGGLHTGLGVTIAKAGDDMAAKV